MTIRKRGNSYMVDVKVGAKDNPSKEPVRVRITVPDLETARRKEAEIRSTVMNHGMWDESIMVKPAHGNAKRQAVGTLKDALEEAWSYPSGRKRGWKFQKTGKIAYDLARKAIEFLGEDRMCVSIVADDIDRLVAHHTSRNLGNQSINLYVQAFYRLLWHAQRKGWITHRPIWERLSPGKPREFIFTEEFETEVLHFFRDIERDAVMVELVTLGIETGMRLQELLQTTPERWDLAGRMVYVPHAESKSGYGRYITLTDRAIATVRPVMQDRERDFKMFPLKPQAVQMRMRKARTFFKMEDNKDFCFHATRHTRATRLARLTRDPFTVMAQLGHSNINISMRYIKMVAMDISTSRAGLKLVASA